MSGQVSGFTLGHHVWFSQLALGPAARGKPGHLLSGLA
jgi:hypothetical protein